MKNDFRLRLYIESKRGSKNVFFSIIVRLKDFVVNNLKRFIRFIFYIYSLYIFKDKYDMVFVIAKYKEDVSWLKDLPYKYIIYDKNDDGGTATNIENSPNARSIKLQNVGREAHTYLTYIIDNYHSLPNFVAFLQGNPFDYSIFLPQRVNRFKGRKNQGFYPLSPIVKYNEEDDYEYRYIKTIEASTLKHFGIKRSVFEFPFGAQFIVSKEKIQKHSIEEYKYLLNKLIEVENKEEGCTRFASHKKPCCCLGEFSAWMLEVWWPIFFGEDRNIINFT